jgi:hypothetical protein
MLWRIDLLLGGDYVNNGRCYLTPATVEQRGYATRF